MDLYIPCGCLIFSLMFVKLIGQYILLQLLQSMKRFAILTNIYQDFESEIAIYYVTMCYNPQLKNCKADRRLQFF